MRRADRVKVSLDLWSKQINLGQNGDKRKSMQLALNCIGNGLMSLTFPKEEAGRSVRGGCLLQNLNDLFIYYLGTILVSM